MYPSNSGKFHTFTMRSNQSTNKIAANDDVYLFFNMNFGNAIKIFDAGVEGDKGSD